MPEDALAAETADTLDKFDEFMSSGDDGAEPEPEPKEPETPADPEGGADAPAHPEPSGATDPKEPEPKAEPESQPEPEGDDGLDLSPSLIAIATDELGVSRAALARAYKADPIATAAAIRKAIADSPAAETSAQTKDGANPEPKAGSGVELPSIEKVAAVLREKGDFSETEANGIAEAIQSLMKPQVDAFNARSAAEEKSRADAAQAESRKRLNEFVSTSEAMFSKVDPDGKVYGKGDGRSLQRANPKAFGERDAVFTVAHVLSSAGLMKPDEALIFAHRARRYEADVAAARESARKDIEDRLEGRTPARTTPPGASRSPKGGGAERESVTKLNKFAGYEA